MTRMVAAPAERRMVTLLVGAAALVIVAAGIRAAAEVVAPVMLALMLVVGVTPVGSWARRHRWPSWAAAALTMLAVYAVVLALVLGLAACVVELAALLPRYEPQAERLVADATDALGDVGLSTSTSGQALSSLDLGRASGLLSALLGSLLSVLGNVFFLLTVLFFLAADAAGFSERMSVLGAGRPALGDALSGFVAATRSYLVTSTVFGAVVAVLDGVALWLLGVPLPLVWALLSFLTNYIPNVGFVIGVIPPAVLALLEGGVGSMTAVLAVYCTLNVVIQTFIQPRVVGDAVGLSASVTILSLAVWGFLLGPLGALLAIPMTLLAKAVLLDADPSTHWASVLLGAPPRTGRPSNAADLRSDGQDHHVPASHTTS